MTIPARATAILTIDIAAIVENWRRIAARVGAAEAAAVVKADSYGLGALRIAPALAAAGCRTFFVATIDEGVAMRRVLPDGRIFALCGAMPGTAAELAEHRLIPVLNSLEQMKEWSAHGKAHGGAPAALHLDTGMSRLGLDAIAVARVAEHPDLLDGIALELVMSHMACADEPDHAKNREQLAAFTALQAAIPMDCTRSLGASSTIFLGPDYHFGLVRPGAALYGLNPIPGKPNPMAPVVGLAGKILQVRDVDTPMTVGYGASHRVTGKGRIATVAVGYADGLFRSLGNRGFGVIGGVRVPVVGRISMDLTTFDVSAAPADAVHPGAFIQLIGPDHDVDELGTEAGTIGYEVLTALGARYTRVYRD